MTTSDEDIYEAPYPHCDSRILHAPQECEYCDHYSLQQHERIRDGIAFTGHDPVGNQVPCPADVARPKGASNDHRRWGGNKPTGALGDPSWPQETYASVAFYGDQGGRST
jgi:hypothetical protein